MKCKFLSMVYFDHSYRMFIFIGHPIPILCLASRTTVTSARIPKEDACHRARNLCVVSDVQKRTPGLTHKGCMRLVACILERAQWRHGRSRDEIKYRRVMQLEFAAGLCISYLNNNTMQDLNQQPLKCKSYVLIWNLVSCVWLLYFPPAGTYQFYCDGLQCMGQGWKKCKKVFSNFSIFCMHLFYCIPFKFPAFQAWFGLLQVIKYYSQYKMYK